MSGTIVPPPARDAASAPSPSLDAGADGDDSPARARPRPGQQVPFPRQGRVPTGPRHLAWLAGLTMLVLLTAAGTAAVLFRPGGVLQRATSAGASGSTGADGAGAGSTGPAATGPASAGPGGLAAAATARAAAAAWIAREVSRNQIIACDTLMCADLTRAGLPAADLLVLRPGAADPLGADLVVATPLLRSQFGTRLASVYAPGVLAAFGSGAARVVVRVLAADGAGAYRRALSGDLAARKAFGTELASNKRIQMAAAAVAEVRAGLVDSRLLIILAALAGQHPIQVLGFFDRPPGAGPEVPLSGARLAVTDGRAGLSSRAYGRWLLRFLRGQRAPFQAAQVGMSASGRQRYVSVRFSRPSPVGLLQR